MTELFSSPCSMPEIITENQKIKKALTESKNIAIIGASPREELAGHYVMKYLLEQNYNIFPVNPKYEGKTILEQKVFKSLEQIDKPIDMVDVFRPAQEALDITKSAIKKNVKFIWLQLGIQCEESKNLAEQSNIIMVMNRCTLIEHKKLL
jgi:predicted CoA-binding protein